MPQTVRMASRKLIQTPERLGKFDEEHFSRLADELSKLLAKPREFPVIGVCGHSSSAITMLYRVLPIAAFSAYSPLSYSETAGTGEGLPVTSPRPAIVRLVTHEGAFYGPQVCAERRCFVDILRRIHGESLLSYSSNSAPSGDIKDDKKGEAAAPVDSQPMEVDEYSHQAQTQAFTEQFFKYLRKRGGFSFDRINALSNDDNHAILPTDAANQEAEAESTASTPSSDGKTTNALRDSVNSAPSAVDLVSHEEGWVHWVVPLWLSTDVHDTRRVLRVWRNVVSGKFAYETGTLVLFINTDVIPGGWFNNAGSQPYPMCRTEELTEPFFPAGVASMPNTEWRTLTKSSELAVDLLQAAGNSPLLQKLCIETATENEPDLPKNQNCQLRELSSLNTSNRMDITTSQRVRLPCLLCRHTINKKYGSGGSFLANVIEVARKMNGDAPKEGPLNSLAQTSFFKNRRAVLTPASALVPSWEWLLPSATLKATALRVRSQPSASSSRKSGHINGTEKQSKRSGDTAAAAEPIFPYILVSDSRSRNAELRRAARRNAVNAASLRLFNAAATVKTNPMHNSSSVACGLLPKPRYYTPFVADTGSPLTVDGCLSDIYVLEFMPECAKGYVWDSWASWLYTHPPPKHAGVSQRDRYAASLHLISTTENFMRTSLPCAADTRALVDAVVRFLSLSGRGHGILLWPLLDPREVHLHPRVAFTLTHELFIDPLRFRVQDNSNNIGNDRGGAAGSKGRRLDAVGRASARAHTEFPHTPFPTEKGSGSESFAGAVSYPLPSRSNDYSFAYTLSAIISRLRAFGWVLVWQEDHRRWPTAVPPPCMSVNDSTTLSRRVSSNTARGAHSTAAITTGLAFGSSLSATPGALQRRIACELEEWRQDQRNHRKIMYDVDAGARLFRTSSLPLSTLPSFSFSHACISAEDAFFAQSLERGLHNPHFPSPYISLDVWQAGLVPEEAGMHLWEGQTVFLENGQHGIIVTFKPPPAKLFTPWAAHPTDQERQFWRGQQQRHATFIHFYRWRQRLRGHSDSGQIRNLAAAFTALPWYVTQREQEVYPVVQLTSCVEGGSNGDRRPCSLSPSKLEPKLVHVLPTKVDIVPMRYPNVCLTTAQQQEAWYAAHPRVWRPPAPLRDVSWRLTMTQHQQMNAVTLLSLPLSPHRVETCASFFLTQVLRITEYPVRSHRLPSSLVKDKSHCEVSTMERLSVRWAGLHRDACRDSAILKSAGTLLHDHVHRNPFGYIRWASFAQKAIGATSTFPKFT